MVTQTFKPAAPKQLSNFSPPKMPETTNTQTAPAVQVQAPAAPTAQSENVAKETAASEVTLAAPQAPNVNAKPLVSQTTVHQAPPSVINTGTRNVNTIPMAVATKPKVGLTSLNTGTRMAAVVSGLTKNKEVAKTAKQIVGDLLSTVPPAYQFPITRLYDYVDRMDPSKRENEDVGAAEQVALYRSIVGIIDGPEEYFQPMFTALLRMFNAFSGPRDVFHDHNCSRYMQVVTLNADERKAFNNLVCFLKLMANPETRHVTARTTDHTRLLAYGLTDTGRNRVTSFLDL
jgi:hypothetical protein